MNARPNLRAAQPAPMDRVLDALARAKRHDYPTWHHASALQARVAESAGHRIRFDSESGWELLATDAEFGALVVDVAGYEP